jgi:hypothetical protein
LTRSAASTYAGDRLGREVAVPRQLKQLRDLTTNCIEDIRGLVGELHNARRNVHRIPHRTGNVSLADYNRQRKDFQDHVAPIVERLSEQYGALLDGFREIAQFLASGGHSKGSKDELRAHYGAMIGFARQEGAAIANFFEGELSDYRVQEPRVGGLFALLEELPEAIPGTD